MSGLLIVFLILTMLATLGALFFGIFVMAKGGEFNLKHGNKVMRVRVLLQGAALLIFAIIMLISG